MEHDNEANLKEKFALETETTKCFNHSDQIAALKCPICKKSYCESCFHVLEQKGVQIKALCRNCYRNWKIKMGIYFIILTILLIMLFS
jgi:hypothetical protein